MRFTSHTRSGFTTSHRPSAVREVSLWARLVRIFKWGVFLTVTFACIFPLMFSFVKTDDDWLATAILGCCFSFMLFTRLFKPGLFSHFFAGPDSSWNDQVTKDFEDDLDDKIVGFNSGVH